ncbi:phage terminase large subunit [Tsuneonella mangrovi]|uniref:phage terminase large subunit n=1 Tax=Tsuneonella mangrovi TaxID=1982042 RepID=UPI000BA2B88C|nr:phage terminase large subunit [Tsuneonella mangrovi]
MNDVDASDAIAALTRLDFAFFLRRAFSELGGDSPYTHNWHIDAIGHQLDRVRQRENRRLIVTMPPRHLKSRIISIAWVAWMLGHNPALSFLCVSYGQDLAEDHARDCLRVMQSRWYREAFPNAVIKRSAVADIQTTAGGRRMATSIDGATTGFGADFIIIDDPMKAQDATSQAARDKVIRWFDETLSQRLNNQLHGTIIVVMQRLHEGDLVGVLKEREGWHELCLPAIATCDEDIPLTHGRVYRRREGCALHPARLPLSELLRKKADNPYVHASQYQQQPVPAHGNMIEAAWLRTYDPATLDMTHGQIVLSLDTASKDNPFNDYSVCLTALVQDQRVYVIDVMRARLQFNPLKAKVIELARLHSAQVMLIEDASSGTALIQSLQAEALSGVPLPIPRRPEGDKIARVMNISSMIEAGRLFLPGQAHWLAEFTGEILGFPSSRHDDQVDALSQLFIWVQLKDRWRAPLNEGPEEMDPHAALPVRDPVGSKDPWSGL